MRAAAALVASLLTSLLAAQDPMPPAGGWNVGYFEYVPGGTNGALTWVDGVNTALDIYFPVATPPASGWPIVVLVHGGEGTRKIPPIVHRARRLAAVGYVCLAYDARGNGVTVTSNAPGFDLSDDAKLRDMAELMVRAPVLVPAATAADPTRVAVSGESMGGRHAYRAAAWSGQPLTAPIAPYTHMPTISAIAPRIAPLDPVTDQIPFGPLLINVIPAKGIVDRGPSDPGYAPLVAEDFVGATAQLANDPVRNYLPQLVTSTVPVLLTNCYEDHKHYIFPTVDALARLNPNMPVRTWWTTNGHSSASNDQEEAANDEAIRRWFDHHVKGRSNGVPLEPDSEAAYPPATRLDHVDPASHWRHALAPAWPPPSTPVTFHLRHNGTALGLLSSAPAATEPSVVIDHVMTNASYTIVDFCNHNANPGPVTANIALDNESFSSPPLTAEFEIVGRPRFDATVDTDSGDFLITACLYSVMPNGNRKFITGGTHGRRGASAGVHQLSIELDETAFVVPAGHRLALDLRNIAIFDWPGNPFIRTVPMFTPSSTRVRIDPATPATLVLPQRPRSHAFLT
ncbi:MAG: hypothetical protein KDC98_01295, partial [Planctomycetes bacterium]|nr:hypothetical protein [Planctomycetota bacterium]